MAHMHYFQSNIAKTLKERVSTLISYLRDSKWPRSVLFSYKGKFGRWEELYFYSIGGQGIGYKRFLYLGAEKIEMEGTSSTGMLKETFFDNLNLHPDIFRIFSKANIIHFYERSSEGAPKLDLSIKISNIENNPENTDYEEYNSIEDFDPVEIMSWIQTYANSSNPEQKEIFFDKLKKLFS